MGRPVDESISCYTQRGPQPSSPIPSHFPTSPTSLSLLTRSLPPNRVRALFTSLFGSLPTSSLSAIANILVDSIDPQDRAHSSLLQPRRTNEPGRASIPPERLLDPETCEQMLSHGTTFRLVDQNGERIWRSLQESRARSPEFPMLPMRVSVPSGSNAEMILSIITRETEDSLFRTLATELSRLSHRP
jgi:hypothetical protein